MQVLPVNPLAPPAASVITYDALDLMWLDGLEGIRALLALSLCADSLQKAPGMFRCQSMADLTWYCSWKGLAPDAQFFEQPPVVTTADLLQYLGVPRQQIRDISANVTFEVLSSLRRMVLPQFVQQAVELMADQLPELDLNAKFCEKLLFAG